MSGFINRNKELLLLLLIYSAAHGLSLLNKGLYWDDWIWYYLKPSLRIEVSNELGVPWGGYYSNFMFSLPESILVFRLLVFSSFGLCIVFIQKILKTVKEITAVDRFFVLAFIAVLPFNMFRQMISLSSYALYVGAFWGGYLMMVRYLHNRNLLLRFFALLAFFFSFNINSLLVFYSLAPLYIVYYEGVSRKSNLKLLAAITIRYWDFMLLPIAFWILRILFLKPYGIYQNYNIIGKNDILFAPLTALYTFSSSVFGVIDQSLMFVISKFWFSPSFFLISAFLIFACVKKCIQAYPSIDMGTIKADKWLIIWGVICFFVGIFPYLAVGHIPSFESYESRHQLLIPLGTALMLVYGLKYIFRLLYNGSMQNIKALFSLYALLLFVFVIADIRIYWNLQKDWFKQESIVHNVRDGAFDFQDYSTYLFKDYKPELTAGNRSILSYEYTGYLRRAFGDEKRLGINYREYLTLPKNSIFNDEKYRNRYLLSKYQPIEPLVVINIEQGKEALNTRKMIKLLFLEWTAHERFSKEITAVTTIRYKLMYNSENESRMDQKEQDDEN